MISKAAAWAEARALQTVFTQAGAVPVEADILQPADTLLDLYGEDVRARAYVTQDALRGEQMLRPDFTVPVVQMHMAHGAEPARYTYAGEVFRKQDDDTDRPNEYLQVGYEVFDRADPAAADAEVFSTFLKQLAPYEVQVETGDVGFLRAAVLGLQTTERRKAALLRHLWRPDRFRQLMTRFGEPARPRTFEDHGAPWIGLRSQEEMDLRIAALAQEASTPPISAEERELIDQLLSLKVPLAKAYPALAELAHALPSLQDGLEAFGRRADAFDRHDIPLASMSFQGSYGLTAMEYYDGFVFGIYAAHNEEMPVLATGGRYDALTHVLGNGASIPAVGGVIRPALLCALKEGS
jgi:ATP phosphoribosyltransferase regulatory subunit